MVFPNHNKRLNPMLNGGKFADREVGTQASRLTSQNIPGMTMRLENLSTFTNLLFNVIFSELQNDDP